MSLAGRTISIDSLPSNQFLKNPLLTHADAPARKTVARAGAAEVTTRVAREPGRAFFNRRPQQQQQQQAEPESDDDDDEEEDEPRAAPHPLNQPMQSIREQHKTGPFSLVADTNKAKLTFMVGFTDLCGAVASGGISKGSSCASATISFKEIIANVKNPRERAVFERLEPTRTVPISIRLMGCSFGDAERHIAMAVSYTHLTLPTIYSV